ncbi:MAG: hypothetical protein ACRENE_22335 [Polyangiaceae bacterium]
MPWNPRDARAFEAKACALGLADACESEGDDRVDADAAGAAVVYRRACEVARGSPHACLKMARAYEAAGAPAATLAAAYRKACEKLSFDACSWVSRNVDGLDAESPGVIAAFRRWCDAGSSRACERVERVPARAR